MLALTASRATFYDEGFLLVPLARMMPVSRLVGAPSCRALTAGSRFRVTVSGGSMEPVLRDGDELDAERVKSPREVALGDLVVVDAPGAGLVVHRLLWRGRRGLRTWGDGSRRMDAPVEPSDLVGRVVAARRDGVDVMPGAFARRVQWGRQFTSAALHRLRRRLDARFSR